MTLSPEETLKLVEIYRHLAILEHKRNCRSCEVEWPCDFTEERLDKEAEKLLKKGLEK